MTICVLITTRTAQKLDEPRSILREKGLEIINSGMDRPLTARELSERLPGISAVIVGVDEVSREVFKGADSLRIVSMNGVGVERIDVAAATEFGIIVTNTPGTNADSVADLALTLILAQARRIPMHDKVVRDGGWIRKAGHELGGQRLGLIGLGSIGKKVAIRAQAFGLYVLAYDPYIDHDFCRVHNIQIVDLGTLLSNSDIVSLHLPLTPETRNIINHETLSAMKPGAVLINTARGELVDEAALVESLRTGYLAGAGLDVFTSEPPKSSPLLEMEQVILTPHIGGNTIEAVKRTATQAAQNVVAALFGGEMNAIVNPEVLKK
jgi:D-3-phosphoglycerate dehydrogenase / 2-oxoglutarate reductase